MTMCSPRSSSPDVQGIADVQGVSDVCDPLVFLVLPIARLGDESVRRWWASSSGRVFVHHDFPVVNGMQNWSERCPCRFQLISAELPGYRNSYLALYRSL